MNIVHANEAQILKVNCYSSKIIICINDDDGDYFFKYKSKLFDTNAKLSVVKHVNITVKFKK